MEPMLSGTTGWACCQGGATIRLVGGVQTDTCIGSAPPARAREGHPHRGPHYEYGSWRAGSGLREATPLHVAHQPQGALMAKSREARERELAKLRAKFGVRKLEPGELTLQRIAVGEPLPGGEVKRGLDGTQLGIDEHGFSLRVLVPTPTAAELTAIQATPLEARLLVGTHTLFFYFRIGGGPWRFEAFFSPWRSHANGYELYTDPGPGYGMLLTIILLDSNTGIVRGLRHTTLSRDFCTAVLAGCSDILGRPMNDVIHAAEVAAQTRLAIEASAEKATTRFSTDDGN
jgi:hypothetical protein